MAKKNQVCRNCKSFTNESICPVCKSTNLSASWKGVVVIIDTNGEIAKMINAKEPGKYALYVGWFMEITTIEEKENLFFKRKEYLLLVKHRLAATPSKTELIKKIAEINNADENQIKIDYIFTKKGMCESIVKVKIFKEKPKEEKKQEGEKIETQTDQAVWDN